MEPSEQERRLRSFRRVLRPLRPLIRPDRREGSSGIRPVGFTYFWWTDRGFYGYLSYISSWTMLDPSNQRSFTSRTGSFVGPMSGFTTSHPRGGFERVVADLHPKFVMPFS